MVDELRELFQRGETVLADGDLEKAASLYEFILGRCEVVQDILGCARARRRLGDIETQRGRFNEAGVHYMKALETLLSSNDLEETARCLRGLGYLHWRKGDYDLATEYLGQGLERALQANKKDIQGCILIDLGNISGSQGRIDACVRSYTQAIVTLEEVAGSFDLDRALLNLGDIYMSKGELEKAAGQFEQAIVHSRERGDKGNLAWALLNLAECRVKEGELRKVPDLLKEASRVLADCDDRVGLAATKRVMGQWATETGDWALAEREFENALADYQEFDMPERRGVVYRLFGEMLAKKGDKARARTMLDMSIDIFEDIGSVREKDITMSVIDGLSAQGRL